MREEISVRTPAKINWFLQVTGRRLDGYHHLRMVNQRIGLLDEVRVAACDRLSLVVEGMAGVPGDNSNLVLRAATLLREHYGITHGAHMTLIKRIPMGAGLGGGSANAAGALLALNRLWRINADLRDLASLALRLGSDVPYCLHSGPALVSGIGEIVHPLGAFPPYWLVLLKPTISLVTADVFQTYRKIPRQPMVVEPDWKETSRALAGGRLEDLSQCCINSLQPAALGLAPDIQLLLDGLWNNGADFAQMTGAGSTVFGAFKHQQKAQVALQELKSLASFSALVPGL